MALTFAAQTHHDLAPLLAAHGLQGASVRLLNVSENATFEVTSVTGQRSILRIYRANRTIEQINSELAWLRALNSDSVISVPNALTAHDGQAVHTLVSDGQTAFAVMFDYLTGAEPQETDLVPWFSKLGHISAIMHQHARNWVRPATFCRPRYDWVHLLGSQPVWGDWRRAPGLTTAQTKLLEAVCRDLEADLAQSQTPPDRLVHGDLRLANLLLSGDTIHVIDFDDCGFSWPLFDLATALNFLEDHPQAAEMAAAWLDAYHAICPVSGRDRARIGALIMTRRIQILSWFASHSDTELAINHGPDMIAATCAAADAYHAGERPFRDV
jgi:Ser/Thr protein kinase RdoA (MazF antagonist)